MVLWTKHHSGWTAKREGGQYRLYVTVMDLLETQRIRPGPSMAGSGLCIGPLRCCGPLLLVSFVNLPLYTDSFHSHTQTNHRKMEMTMIKIASGKTFLKSAFLVLRREKISDFSKSFLIHVSLIPHTRLTSVPTTTESPEDHNAGRAKDVTTQAGL